MVAGRLGSAGYSVLVLEAGGPTQRSLGGASSGAGRWTVFDVPLGWLQVLSDHRWSKEFQWSVPADPPPAVARGLGMPQHRARTPGQQALQLCYSRA